MPPLPMFIGRFGIKDISQQEKHDRGGDFGKFAKINSSHKPQNGCGLQPLESHLHRANLGLEK